MSALDNARANLVNELKPLLGKHTADVVEAIEIFVSNLILAAKEELK